MTTSEPEAIRELSEIELDTVSGGTVMWGAITGTPPVTGDSAVWGS